MIEKLTQFNLHHRVAESKAETLVYFSALGCASCRHLGSILALLHKKRPNWRIFEVDAQEDMALTQEFEVFHLPSLFLFYNGEYHQEIKCEASLSKIIQAIEQAIQEPAHEAP